MQQEKLITMNESKKYETICRVIKKEITQKTASSILNLTVRQIRNLSHQVKLQGIDGIIHKNKGRPSNNHPVPEDIKQTIINLATTKYEGFRVVIFVSFLVLYSHTLLES